MAVLTACATSTPTLQLVRICDSSDLEEMGADYREAEKWLKIAAS